MSISKLIALARKHWNEHLPQRVRELRAQGTLDEELQGAANLAQAEIEQLKSRGYQEYEAWEVVLPTLILLPTERDDNDEQAQEWLEKERNYQETVAPFLTMRDDDDDLPIR